MSIQINGSSDVISATDGSLSITGALSAGTIQASGTVTASGQISTGNSITATGVVNASNYLINNNPIPIIKAWVNFDGSLTTPVIRASSNIASVVRIPNPTSSAGNPGAFRITFATPMTTTTYAVVGTVGITAGQDEIYGIRVWGTPTQSSFSIVATTVSGGGDSYSNPPIVSILVMG